jgi:hypothetical protein
MGFATRSPLRLDPSDPFHIGISATQASQEGLAMTCADKNRGDRANSSWEEDENVF